MFRRIARPIHLVAASLLVVGLLVQVFLAGLGIFADESAFATHRVFGHLLEVFPIILLVTALVAGYGRTRAVAGLGLLAMLLLQTVLVLQRGSSDILAALHPVNGSLVLLAAVWVAWDSMRMWQASRVQEPEGATSPEGLTG